MIRHSAIKGGNKSGIVHVELKVPIVLTVLALVHDNPSLRATPLRDDKTACVEERLDQTTDLVTSRRYG